MAGPAHASFGHAAFFGLGATAASRAAPAARWRSP
jgi:ABC-type branched-subunit amino acid transport system permease subunit